MNRFFLIFFATFIYNSFALSQELECLKAGRMYILYSQTYKSNVAELYNQADCLKAAELATTYPITCTTQGIGNDQKYVPTKSLPGNKSLELNMVFIPSTVVPGFSNFSTCVKAVENSTAGHVCVWNTSNYQPVNYNDCYNSKDKNIGCIGAGKKGFGTEDLSTCFKLLPSGGTNYGSHICNWDGDGYYAYITREAKVSWDGYTLSWTPKRFANSSFRSAKECGEFVSKL